MKIIFAFLLAFGCYSSAFASEVYVSGKGLSLSKIKIGMAQIAFTDTDMSNTPGDVKLNGNFEGNSLVQHVHISKKLLANNNIDSANLLQLLANKNVLLVCTSAVEFNSNSFRCGGIALTVNMHQQN